MPTCPNGHQSGSEDWCEVCGHRMTGTGAPAGAVPPPPPPPPAPGYDYPPVGNDGGPPTMQAELCPQCRTPREAMAPFCEECRWNFITSTATSYTPLAPRHSTPGGSGAPGGPPPGLNLPPGFLAQQGPPSGGPEGQGGQGGQGGPSGPGGQGGHGGQSGPSGPGGQGGPPPHAFQQGPPPPPVFQQAPPTAHQQQAPSPFEPEQQAPSAFEPQQSAPSPFAPPRQSHQQQQAQQPQQPAQQQPPHGGGEDDWILSPPSQAQVPQPPQAPQPPQGFQQQGPYQGGNPDRNQPPPYGGNDGYGQGPGHGQGQGQGQPQQATPTTWTAVIAPDREYFLAMMQRSGPEASGLNLPAYSPEQRMPLTGSQVTIGRRRHSTGESPDIDLSVPPEDPGVSHQHAVLVQQPDGSWSVVDQKSTNGTTLNGAEDPIQPYVPVPLQDGDQVHVGAWTTITIRRD
ncbi:FHA domain-containing protein [Streptomyces sp. B27]|uniref:FHA domain-containing protein n=1 Tax=Streptomyces sp. B27 TaxID=2485015 RepID=UPI000FD9B8C1|nr:FHA domain-containing protein [Streptomyces sp. B27]